jgi:hypothetical protein
MIYPPSIYVSAILSCQRIRKKLSVASSVGYQRIRKKLPVAGSVGIYVYKYK